MHAGRPASVIPPAVQPRAAALGPRSAAASASCVTSTTARAPCATWRSSSSTWVPDPDRGCRWVRRRAPAVGRSPAPGRSTVAAARRPRAARDACRQPRSGQARRSAGGARSGAGAAVATQPGGQQHVLLPGQLRDQVEELEHEAPPDRGADRSVRAGSPPQAGDRRNRCCLRPDDRDPRSGGAAWTCPTRTGPRARSAPRRPRADPRRRERGVPHDPRRTT